MDFTRGYFYLLRNLLCGLLIFIDEPGRNQRYLVDLVPDVHQRAAIQRWLRSLPFTDSGGVLRHWRPLPSRDRTMPRHPNPLCRFI